MTDYDRQECYNAKLLELLGFPVEFDEEDMKVAENEEENIR
jgi:hypothetical protein